MDSETYKRNPQNLSFAEQVKEMYESPLSDDGNRDHESATGSILIGIQRNGLWLAEIVIKEQKKERWKSASTRLLPEGSAILRKMVPRTNKIRALSGGLRGRGLLWAA